MPAPSLPPRRSSPDVRIRNPAGGPACFLRITRIHERLLSGRRTDAELLAGELEISVRTVKRDIERLRRDHNAPIEWEPSTQTYFYSAPFDLFSSLRLDAAETLAVVLAGRTFSAWGDSPLGKTLTAALSKIARFAGRAVSIPAEDMRACLFQPETDSSLEAEHRHFARFLEDILQHRELTLVYRKPRSAQAETRVVQPLHLACLDHRWMLVAHDTARGAWRNFLLSRIEAIVPTGNRFKPPPREKILRHLGGSLGRFTGDTEMEVRITFDSIAAPYVRERPWHASQTISDRPDGSIEVTLRLNNLIDVQRRILACGRHAQVLAPPELRQTLAAEIAALAQIYAPEIETSEKISIKNPAGHPLSLRAR